ncbi:MAG: glutamine--tRNA ligase/YqeY domain fusion protein [Polyangiaceae bacterium]
MTEPKNDFIRQIVHEDNRTGKHAGRVQTRFPPEPNGFLHIGHAKSICLNFGLAQEFGGQCFLRFDDTNPATEDELFIRSIQEDVKWLGFDWGPNLRFASEYFDACFEGAERLIDLGLAYVCDLTSDQIREQKGVPGKPGENSPFRDRSAAENRDLFARMRAGEFADGSRTLRAKIDMASPNFNLRDPVMYRIKRMPHPKTGTKWVVYPMYDYAHCVSDAIEGTTHSICTLEFEDHRPLYDWFLDKLRETPFASHLKSKPQQIEFAKLNVDYTVTSKRKLKELVLEKHVAGWDDPRMPTLAGLRRRGFTPEALRDFCERGGVAKNEGVLEVSLLEHCVREDLDRTASRRMCVQQPLKFVITNWPADRVDWVDAPNHPQKPELGDRKIALSREVWIEATDFMLDPPKKFFRLGPGREVRLRNGPIIKCEEVVKGADGEVVELRGTFDESSLDKAAPPRKVKGVIHFVSVAHAVPCEVRVYDRLFSVPAPTDVPEGVDYKTNMNPKSLEIVERAFAEPALASAAPGERFQFERTGYFSVDPDSTRGKLVFNRTVGLRDSWAKQGESPE